MYEYEKTLLYLYPVADELTSTYRDRAHGKIRASFFCHDGAEEQILETISLIVLERTIESAKKEVETALKELTVTERALLEIQFIRRRRAIEAIPFRKFPFSKRSYYRKTYGAVKRLSSILKKNGSDLKWFEESFADCPEVMLVYGKVKSGQDLNYRRNIEGFSFTSTGDKKKMKSETAKKCQFS